MLPEVQEVKTTDVLVIGGGAAALRAAYEASRQGVNVLVASKGTIGASGCSNLAGSEYMAYGAALGQVDGRDNPREHEKDTLHAAMGMADEQMVRILTEETGDRFLELVEMGGKFDKQENGKFAQRVSDAASYPRVLGRGDTTGREIMRVLMAQLEGKAELLQDVSALDLLTDGDAVCGALLLRAADGAYLAVYAKAVLLATGGSGGLYQFDTFPADVAGDGHGMAWRAGAEFVGTEFLQIGLVLAQPRLPRIISATTWKLEPEIYNDQGEDLLAKYLPAGKDKKEIFRLKATSFPFSWRTDSLYIDLSVYEEVRKGRKVFVDVSRHSQEKILSICPNNYRFLKSVGVDITRDPIQVSCGVQHMNGGILIDEFGKTTLPGLFAAGECAGGAHGADRPGGNALADTQVYGRRSALSAAEFAKGRTDISPDKARLVDNALRYEKSQSSVNIAELHGRLRHVMWEKALVFRDEQGLSWLLGKLDNIEAELPASVGGDNAAQTVGLRNALVVGRLIAYPALKRTESRGTHYRTDYPAMDNEHWNCQIITKAGGNGVDWCLRQARKNG